VYGNATFDEKLPEPASGGSWLPVKGCIRWPWVKYQGCRGVVKIVSPNQQPQPLDLFEPIFCFWLLS
jgi:hypothetical protein